VVDTPRRARPSRAEADDGGVHAPREFGDLAALGLGRSDARLGVEDDDVADAEPLAGEPGELVGVLVERPPRAIDADAEDLVAERGEARRQWLRVRRAERDGRKYLKGAHAPSCREGARRVKRSRWPRKPGARPARPESVWPRAARG